jgi:hypothetical protein
MASGIEMMMKSLGIDPGKIMADFLALKDGVIKELQGINSKIERIEKSQEDFRQWLRKELEQERTTQQQPQAVQQPQKPQPQLQPMNPQPQERPQNPPLPQ